MQGQSTLEARPGGLKHGSDSYIPSPLKTGTHHSLYAKLSKECSDPLPTQGVPGTAYAVNLVTELSHAKG